MLYIFHIFPLGQYLIVILNVWNLYIQSYTCVYTVQIHEVYVPLCTVRSCLKGLIEAFIRAQSLILNLEFLFLR